MNVKEVLKGGWGEECARERNLRKILWYKNIRVYVDQVILLEMFKLPRIGLLDSIFILFLYFFIIFIHFFFIG